MNTNVETDKQLSTWGEMLLNLCSSSDNKIQILTPTRMPPLSADSYISFRGNWSGEQSCNQPPMGIFLRIQNIGQTERAT